MNAAIGMSSAGPAARHPDRTGRARVPRRSRGPRTRRRCTGAAADRAPRRRSARECGCGSAIASAISHARGQRMVAQVPMINSTSTRTITRMRADGDLGGADRRVRVMPQARDGRARRQRRGQDEPADGDQHEARPGGESSASIRGIGTINAAMPAAPSTAPTSRVRCSALTGGPRRPRAPFRPPCGLRSRRRRPGRSPAT